MKRSAWGTRFGFYLAAVGSAFGLGNLWRFPYVVAENGGGAFVLIYILLVFLLGMPLLIGELLLGKTTRRSMISAVDRLKIGSSSYSALSSGVSASTSFLLKLLPLAGRLSLFVALMVLGYFAVISGWVLHFFMQFLVGLVTTDTVSPSASLTVLMGSGWLQVLLASVHLLLVVVIVAKDVEEGIERWVGYMTPLFVLLLTALVLRSLSLETTPEALRFLLYPDFSKLKISSLGYAIGHVLFTLSIGFGTMVTFGSYMRERSYIPISGFRVATLDSVISLFAGLLIFPLVISSATDAAGPDLLFRAVPALLASIQGGYWFGIGFFVCLYIAALGASIGLLETIVANLRDSYKVSRGKGTIWAGGACFIMALFPALSSSALQGWSYNGRGVLEILDLVLINWVLPLTALVVSQIVAYRLADKVKREQFISDENLPAVKLYSHWNFALRWIVPPVIILGLVLQLVGLFI